MRNQLNTDKEPGVDDRWFSVDEIADYLGVSKDAVYSWVTSKGMPGYKVGRFWKFKKEDVDRWVREGGAASSSDEELQPKESNQQATETAPGSNGG